MVTKSEEQVIKEYKNKGYFYVHSGSPDFLFYKINNLNNSKIRDIDINSVEFVEVKYNKDVLNHEQQIWKHILNGLNLKYKLINIPYTKSSIGIK